MARNKKNRKRVEQEIEIIMNNALAYGKTITFTQASAIRRRSIKLKQESRTHPTINPKEKARQIELCWKLYDEGRV
ncbi:MAG: hypothetical protein ACXAC5_04535 [Promethearchaeota archaeon]|jgi:hypothetical protein